MRINHINIPVYHLQTNGQTERFIDTLKRTIIKMDGIGSISKNLEKFPCIIEIYQMQSQSSQIISEEVLMG